VGQAVLPGDGRASEHGQERQQVISSNIRSGYHTKAIRPFKAQSGFLPDSFFRVCSALPQLTAI
jgi:hypothetical protein